MAGTDTRSTSALPSIAVTDSPIRRYVSESSSGLAWLVPTNAASSFVFADARSASPEICGELVGQDRLVVALRRDHPLARGRLTARRYAEALHVLVSRRGRLRDPIDDALDALGLRRRVVAAAPTTAAAMHFVRESDLVVALPARVCGPALRALGLGALPLPVDVPELRIVQLWHRRYENHKAHAWLRGRTREIVQDIDPRSAVTKAR